MDEVIERALGDAPPESKQDQYNVNTREGQIAFLRKLVHLVDKFDEAIPRYEHDSRKRDAKLLEFARSEPILAGVLNNVVTREKARSWRLVGAARQVSIYSQKLQTVNYGAGWRTFVGKLAHSYYATNLGFAAEIGFNFKGGPAETLYSFDPTRLRTSGNPEYPFYYFPKLHPVLPNTVETSGIKIAKDEVIYGNALTSVEEEMYNVGHCAVDRALEFIRIMMGLNTHLFEKLDVAPPKGILHIKGIIRSEWESALDQAQEAQNNANIQVYKDIIALLTSNENSAIEMIPLSELPDNFSMFEFIEAYINLLALNFGTSPWNLWSLRTGNSLGRGTEAKTSVEQSKIRGELDMPLQLEAEVNMKFVPNSVLFTFDLDDAFRESESVSLNAEYAGMVVNMFEKGLIDQEMGLKLLAEKAIVPQNFLDGVTDQEASDLQETRMKAKRNPAVQRAAYMYPDEPIISVKWLGDERRAIKDIQRFIDPVKYPISHDYEVEILYERGSQMVPKVF